MRITLWGTRGSLASAGPDTVRYGGNTSCVSIEGMEGVLLVIDAGTGIRSLGREVPKNLSCVHLLLTHLHMDHLQGLPFFEPLHRPGVEVHIWGPASTTANLHASIVRYLSPPLFPVRVRDLLSDVHFHELATDTIEIGKYKISSQPVIHPNPTLGFRLQDGHAIFTYLSDHEPALGSLDYPRDKEWTSGYALAEGADLLIHDAQYTEEEYLERIGYGHSSMRQAFQFAALAEVKQLIPFHHDPAHDDDTIDRMIQETIDELKPSFVVTPGMEGTTIQVV